MSTIKDTVEYLLIKDHYGDRCAQRSRAPLINHIDEGLMILQSRNASNTACRAFCLHPLVQGDQDLLENWQKVSTESNKAALLLTMEYRNIANQYLSRRSISSLEDIVLSPLHDVNEMLVADKIQNYKDFLLYHKDTHPRAKELDTYFNNWLKRLGIENFDYYRDLLSQQRATGSKSI